jgi:hypothetical protein
VVSFSIEEFAEFLYGDVRDVDKAKEVLLEEFFTVLLLFVQILPLVSCSNKLILVNLAG